MDTTNIVYYMGASMCILAISRLFGVQIEPIYIICYSIAGLIFLLHEIWHIFHVTFNKMDGKNVKRSFIHRRSVKFFKNKRSGEIFIYSSMLAIFFIPHLTFIEDLIDEFIATVSDFISLFALGLTLVTISIKQLKPASDEELREHLIDLPKDEEISCNVDNKSKRG